MSKLGKGVDNYYIRSSLRLYLEGMSFRGIERVLGVSHVSVINGVKKYGKDLKPLHTGEENPIKAVEVDEFHSYVKTKKTVYGSGLLWIEQVKGCWVLPSGTEVKRLEIACAQV
ncbi:MAG: hypothetical protein GDA51_03730 [Ekhidna sp.]|nr:hypothetical protein [Ekhidna sp.]